MCLAIICLWKILIWLIYFLRRKYIWSLNHLQYIYIQILATFHHYCQIFCYQNMFCFVFFYERIEKTIIKKRKKGKFKMSASRSSIRCLIASALTSLESNELLKDEAHQAKIFFHFVRHMNKVYFSCVYVFELLTLFLFS